MADAWATNNWVHRHFAEGLGFWEVNVYKALLYWHPTYKKVAGERTLGHLEFRKRLAFALLTLGKAEYGAASSAAGGADARAAPEMHEMAKFDNYTNEHHQCSWCQKGIMAGWYCVTCCPNGNADHAFCNPSTGRRCYAMHCAGTAQVHGLRLGIQKKALRSSPRRRASGGASGGCAGASSGRGGRGRGARRSI